MRMTRGSSASSAGMEPVGREIAIGLVEDEERAGGQLVEDRHLLRRGEPAAGRIVRVGKIDEPRAALLRRVAERFGVVAERAIRRGHEFPAETVHMEGEGRIGALRHHDGIAGIDHRAHDESQEIVGAGAQSDLRALDAVMLGERFAQHIAFGVAIPVDLRCALANRGHRLGRRAEGAFVGADADGELAPYSALEGFGRHERHDRRQGTDEPRIADHGVASRSGRLAAISPDHARHGRRMPWSRSSAGSLAAAGWRPRPRRSSPF